jgi:hypothetical protein
MVEKAMITFRCEKCAVLMQAPPGKIGRHVTCNKCQHVTICPPASILVPLRPAPAPASARKPRRVGSPEFVATLGAIGLACVVWTIWTVAASS